MPYAQTGKPWIEAYPELRNLEPATAKILEGATREGALAAGDIAYRVGSPCEAYALILEGTTRVQRISDSGREIVLYRMNAGETCV